MPKTGKGASVGAAVGAAVSTTTGGCVGAAVGAAVGVVHAESTSTEMIKILPRIHARLANIYSSPYIDTVGLENRCDTWKQVNNSLIYCTSFQRP
jgi:hypothetical protein